MPAGEVRIGVNRPMQPGSVYQIQGISVRNLLVMIRGIDLVRNEELALIDRIGMGVQVSLPAFSVIRTLAVFFEETPSGFRPARDEHLRSEVDNRVSAIPLDIARFIRVRTAPPHPHPEVN